MIVKNEKKEHGGNINIYKNKIVKTEDQMNGTTLFPEFQECQQKRDSWKNGNNYQRK